LAQVPHRSEAHTTKELRRSEAQPAHDLCGQGLRQKVSFKDLVDLGGNLVGSAIGVLHDQPGLADGGTKVEDHSSPLNDLANSKSLSPPFHFHPVILLNSIIASFTIFEHALGTITGKSSK